MQLKLYDKLSKRDQLTITRDKAVSSDVISCLKASNSLTNLTLYDALIINESLLGGDLNYNEFSNLFNAIKNYDEKKQS